ncbi:MAG: hypothetical protein ACI9WC_000775 [Arenicella sp.]|jgi:hypothetical protein
MIGQKKINNSIDAELIPRCVFTIVANNYLPYARALMKSVEAFTPNVRRVVFLCDRVQQDDKFDDNDFELICVEELDIPSLPNMAFNYSIVELCTAVKPICFQYLLNQQIQQAVYLDPDINTYGPLNSIFDLLNNCNILLTPHLTSLVSDSKRPNEVDILRAGAYNLGFIGVSKNEESSRFLSWWSERLKTQCIASPDKGLFVDQKWIDLVPGLFDGVNISRNPGFNIAYWNLAQRLIIRSHDDTLSVDNEPVIFIHYSGINPKKKEFSRHQNRFNFDNLPHVIKDLATQYIQQLLGFGALKTKENYQYGQFHNGHLIDDSMRLVFRESEDAFEIKKFALDDPEFRHQLIEILNRPVQATEQSKRNLMITRLMYQRYRSRDDLRTRYPDVFGADAYAFANWFVLSSESDANVPHECRLYVQQQLDLGPSKLKNTKFHLLNIYHKSPMIRHLILRFTSQESRDKLLQIYKKK